MRTDETRAEPSADPRAAERARILRGIHYCLLVFLGLRIGLTVVATLGTALVDGLDAVDVPGWAAHDITPGWHNVITAWERFDGLWFLRIADGGYVDGDGSAAFFPLYPLVVRAFSWIVGGHPLAAGLFVSNAAFAGALVAVYFLTEGERGEETARRTVLYTALFPTAFFFLAPYSESLFLLLAATCLWAMRRQRWVIAGVTGALAASTRSIGIVLALVLLVEAVHRWREEGRFPVAGVVAALAVPLGTIAYFAFWAALAGDFLAPIHQQASWEREAALPFWTLWAGTREAFRWIGFYPGGYHLLDWLLVVPGLVAAVWVGFRARPAFAAYAWASLLVPLAYVFPARPFMSLPRFILTIVPLFWAAAAWSLRRPGFHTAWVAISGAGLGLMTVLFVTWHYVF